MTLDTPSEQPKEQSQASGYRPPSRKAPREGESLGDYLSRLHRITGRKFERMAKLLGLNRKTYFELRTNVHGARDNTIRKMPAAWNLPEAYFERFLGRYNHTIIPIRTIVQDTKLVADFIGVPVDKKTLQWFQFNLSLMAEQADRWEAYWKKKALVEQRKKQKEIERLEREQRERDHITGKDKGYESAPV